jgi:reverse gyrase
LCEGFVKLENLQKFVPIDQVDITVGEGANVDRGLTDLGIAPERIPENVTFA